MSSIRDVAALASVSVGTVSRVINGYADVAPELRIRVEAAMRELDFRPNVLARNFRQQRSRIIGVVVPDITAPFFADLVKQIESVALEAGYAVLVGNSDNRSDIENEYLMRLHQRGADGLVFAPASRVDRVLRPGGSPMVAVDLAIEGVDLVACDHRSGAGEAVEHLVALGHRRIACISGPQPVFQQREDGYLGVVAPLLLADGIDPGSYVRIEPMGRQSGIEGANALLDLPSPPTAIFATSDQQAFGILRACADRRLRIPEDVSVVGFDDIPLAALMVPRLTTVRQPTQRIGRLVIERLVERLRDPTGPIRQLVLPGELMVRGSSGPAASG